MGMFDNVNYECDCPKCGKKVRNFQSKDLDCLLDTVEPKDVRNFYAMCDNCKFWIEFDYEPPIRPIFVMQGTGIRVDALTLETLPSDDLTPN